MTVEKILEKIDSFIVENNKLWDVLNEALEIGPYEYYFEDYGGDFCAGGYDGDSLSHMLDIIQEQNYILGKLVEYIKSEDTFNEKMSDKCHID